MINLKTYKLTPLVFRFFFQAILFFFSSQLYAAPEQVSIQLKWQHSFQFAGYYAAIEKGFYRDAGLDVTLKEFDFSKDFVQQVIDGASEYGVSDSALLIYHLKGKPVVLLNQFFQHSPLVFLSRRGSGIISPYEMSGKKIAFNVTNLGDASLNVMLLNTLGDLSKIKEVPFGTPYYKNFIDGKTDVVSAYSTSQPYLFKQQGIEVNIINPQSYGIDFYGDNFFTSLKELRQHPKRVKKMRAATTKGWQYALDHPDEIIQLIRKKYAPALSEDYLQYEARTTRQMILPELIPLGSIDPRRYQRAAEEYQRLGFVEPSQIESQFFYQQHKNNGQNTGLVKLSVQEKAWIKANPTVSLGGMRDWPPFEFVNKHGKYQGIANDYINLIAEKTGLKFNVLPGEWSSNLHKIRNKQIDLLATAYYTKERSQYLNYLTAYTELLEYFFIRDGLNIKTIEDLNGKRVAMPKDYAQADILKEHFPKINLVIVDSSEAAIDAVLENRADALYDSYAVLAYTLKKDGISSIIPFKSAREIRRRPMHFVSRKGAPELASIMEKGLGAITEKEKQAIYSRWSARNLEIEKPAIQLSQAEKQWLAKHKVIRFTGAPNWLPYEAFDKKGHYIGIVAEHLKLIEQKLGIKVDIIPTKTWAESVAKVKNGEIDVLSETSDSALKSQLGFTQDYISSPVVIVMDKDEGYVDSIEQIKHKSIAVIKQYGYVPEITEKYPDLELHFVDTIQQGLTAVSTGQVDALVATMAHVGYSISELGMNNLRIVGKTEFNTNLAFGMREQFSPLIPLFNRALDSISKGEKQRILSHWGKLNYKAKIDYALLFEIAALFLIIIAVISYWNRKLTQEITLRKGLEYQTQMLIDNIPFQIVVTSLQGDFLTANPKALTENKIHQDEISKFNILDFYENIEDREAIINELAENDKVEQKIVPFKKRDGSVRSMMVSVIPVFYQNQNALLTISVDMTERLELESELKKAKENAESANRAKSEFLANMSHEIRTPMNAILGFTDILAEQVKEPKLKSFVNTIHSAGNNLLSLINDILDLSKIEAGKLEIRKVASNPYEMFTELGNVFMMNMREKDIEFILDIDPAIPQSLLIDVTRLRQVLFNLIGNAVKFTDMGAVRVIARADNKDEIRSKVDLLIDVEDSGIGIAEDQQAAIFQDFQQSSGQDVRKYAGTGLGLSISKRLVGMMGGQLSLKSQLGQGSTFTIKLTGVDVATCKVDEVNIPFNNLAVNFAPAQILVVDDVADNRGLLQALFANTQLQIVEAENGLDAVNLAKQQSFDFVLMDIRMPVMDGYQATKEIKVFSDVPIVALTASVMSEEFEQIKQCEFDGYLTKPVVKKELFNELCKFLPFEEKIVAKAVELDLILSDKERQMLPLVFAQLEKLVDRRDSITKSNNISAIRLFAGKIKQIVSQYPIKALSEYATKIEEQVDSFDIMGIKKSLEQYPKLIKQLDPFEHLDADESSQEEDELTMPEFINIDSKIGLFYVDNNKEFYLQMLKNFADEYKDLNLDNLDDQAFKIKTHSIKSLSATIGATKLHAVAKKLDETQNKQLLSEFYKALNDVVSEVEKNSK